jgi:uncharacterized protein (TIGR03084 family)
MNDVVAGLDELVDDLDTEQSLLQSLLRDLAPDDWFRPTPSWQWDVRDTVAHLADTDAVALDTMRGGPRALGVLVSSLASPEDVTLAGVLHGRRRRGPEVLRWWEDTSAAEREALRALTPADRVPWGLGMSPRAFVTARIMETWAHGLDLHAALGVQPVDSMRLAHVAWIATRAIPYAFTVAGVEMPDAPVRVELTMPDGSTWSAGPADAADRITGPAGPYCRIFVQRLAPSAAPDVVAHGDAARLWLAVARAYL